MAELEWKPRNKFFGKGDIRFIIVHGISEYLIDHTGDFGEKNKVYRFDVFLKMMGLSYHKAVLMDGKIENAQDLDKWAWHAGKLSFAEGIWGLNPFSLGIAFVVQGINTYGQFLRKMENPETYTEEQYIQGSILIAELCRKNKLDSTKMYRHMDVSGPEYRPKDPKKDPGNGFDFIRLQSMVESQLF